MLNNRRYACLKLAYPGILGIKGKTIGSMAIVYPYSRVKCGLLTMNDGLTGEYAGCFVHRIPAAASKKQRRAIISPYLIITFVGLCVKGGFCQIGFG